MTQPDCRTLFAKNLCEGLIECRVGEPEAIGLAVDKFIQADFENGTAHELLRLTGFLAKEIGAASVAEPSFGEPRDWLLDIMMELGCGTIAMQPTAKILRPKGNPARETAVRLVEALAQQGISDATTHLNEIEDVLRAEFGFGSWAEIACVFALVRQQLNELCEPAHDRFLVSIEGGLAFFENLTEPRPGSAADIYYKELHAFDVQYVGVAKSLRPAFKPTIPLPNFLRIARVT